jgi:hypothetical protein
VIDPQPIKLTGATGITFKSGDPTFDGAASDVYFVAHGNVYQIAAYARNDALLKSILASWTFF